MASSTQIVGRVLALDLEDFEILRRHQQPRDNAKDDQNRKDELMVVANLWQPHMAQVGKFRAGGAPSLGGLVYLFRMGALSWRCTAVMLLSGLGAACGGASPATSTMTSPSPPATQVWADEFNGPANSAPEAAKWTYDLGGGGWGNQELETYTNQPQNVYVDGDGHLIIRVERSGSTYTSARLKTQGLFAARYGTVESRIRLPFGQGIWPAFWMLGTNITSAGWPGCGEIDIMENIGREPSINHGSAHGPGYSGGNSVTGLYTLPGGARFSDDFHVFAIQWAPGTIKFFVDGTLYKTATTASLPAGAPWVFDNPFFLILNVAVGGNFSGAPDASTQFPQQMMVDYVRVSGS
jgi:beta-glucanase (GH16 family)